jgi:pimeloyl-ACP methyl ester carboxylesterase
MNDLQPPPRSGLLRETRALANLAQMCHRLTRRVDNQLPPDPIMLFPGFGAGHRTMQPLRLWLQRHGLPVEHWGLGRNIAGLDLRHTLDDISPGWVFDPLPVYRGEAGVPLLADRAGARVRERSEALEQPLTLIGWSLGGTIAREIARDLPEHVAQVITLGSPVQGGPKYTAAAARLARRGLDLDWIERQIERRERRPIRVQVDAVFSPSDAIVAAGAAIDTGNPNARHHEIDVAHLGMAFHPRVWDLIVDILTTGRSAHRSKQTG